MRAFHPAHQTLLQYATESQLLADGRNQCDDQQVEQQPADGVDVEHLLSGGGSRFFQHLKIFFQLLKNATEAHGFVPACQLVGDGQGDEHQDHTY